MKAAQTRPAPLEPATANAFSEPKDESARVWWCPPQVPGVAPRDEIAVKENASPAKAEAIYSDALPAVYDGEYDNPIWAVVMRGAKLHSEPGVSSPTTWVYAVGTKLNVVGYRQGWYQIVDPVSSRRGFIYANYYLEALSGPTNNAVVPTVAKAPAPAPTRTALAEPAPAVTAKPAAPRVSQSSLSRLAPAEPVQQLAPPATRARFVPTARPSYAANRDGVESLLEKAMRR